MPQQGNTTADTAARGRRTALAVACLLGVLGAPACAGTAYADSPAPSPSPGALAESPVPPDAADAGPTSLEQVRRRIAELHDRAGAASEEYNAAEEKAKRQQKEIASLERRVDATRRKLDTLNSKAGALARAQYRNGGTAPDLARLMLADDPAGFLRDAGLLRKGQQATKGFLEKLKNTRTRLEGYAEDAAERGDRLERNRKEKAAAKKRVKKQLKKAKQLQSRLAEDELEKLLEMERQAASARHLRWLKSGILKEIDGKASEKGRRAIAYATAQIGKDYEWGAEGPATYDCSGLTMRAWQSAGEHMPRTSQEQWKRLPRVAIRTMRPGDLIIYKDDASHVGMYVGDGAMVHAPRTGREITVEGAGSLPILGVVRPDK